MPQQSRHHPYPVRAQSPGAGTQSSSGTCWMNGRMDECWMDRWVNGGWMNEWTGGWAERCKTSHPIPPACNHALHLTRRHSLGNVRPGRRLARHPTASRISSLSKEQTARHLQCPPSSSTQRQHTPMGLHCNKGSPTTYTSPSREPGDPSSQLQPSSELVPR